MPILEVKKVRCIGHGSWTSGGNGGSNPGLHHHVISANGVMQCAPYPARQSSVLTLFFLGWTLSFSWHLIDSDGSLSWPEVPKPIPAWGTGSLNHSSPTFHQFNPETHLNLQLMEKDASLSLDFIRMRIKESSRRKTVVEGKMMAFLLLCSDCGQHRVREITNEAPCDTKCQALPGVRSCSPAG